MATPRRAAPPGAGAAGGFAVAEPGPGVAGPAATTATAALDGLLQLQEFDDTATRDRQARRHGHALLQELAELQRSLLGDGPLEGVLDRLNSLVETLPLAADPGLAATISAIALRARVELARRGR